MRSLRLLLLAAAIATAIVSAVVLDVDTKKNTIGSGEKQVDDAEQKPQIADGVRTAPPQIETKPPQIETKPPQIADGGWSSPSAKVCEDSPPLLCLKICPAVVKMCGPGLCAMRQGSCSCEFKCIKPEQPAKVCKDSPPLLCKKICPAVVKTCGPGLCAMRQGSCCEFKCIKPEQPTVEDQKVIPVSKTSICDNLGADQKGICKENFEEIMNSIKKKDCSSIPEKMQSVCKLLQKFNVDGESPISVSTISKMTKALCGRLSGEQKQACENKCEEGSAYDKEQCQGRKEVMKSLSSCKENPETSWCKVSRPDSSTSDKADCNAKSWKAMSDRQVAFCCARKNNKERCQNFDKSAGAASSDKLDCSDRSILQAKTSPAKLFCCAKRQLSPTQCKETGFGDAVQIDCQSDDISENAKTRCCLDGRLPETLCKSKYGLKDRLPDRCVSKGPVVIDNSLGVEANLEKIACRVLPSDDKNAKTDETQKKMKQDPRRDNDLVSDKIKDLTSNGKRCVENLQLSINAIKTLTSQWRGDPTAKIADLSVLKKQSIAEVFEDATQAAIAAQKIQDSFSADNIDTTTNELLPANEVDNNKPPQCQDEWKSFKDQLRDVIANFKLLPDRFKNINLQATKIAFSSLDMGSIVWSESKNVCEFAEKLVSDIKKVKSQLDRKLNMVRKDLCEEAGKIVVGSIVGDLAICIRQARDKSTKADMIKNDEVYQRIKTKSDTIFSTLKRKCVSKPKDDGTNDASRFDGKTHRKFKFVLKGLKALDLTATKANVEQAIRQQNPDAEEVSVVVEKISRRTRRHLADSLNVKVEISAFGAPSNPDYESAIEISTGAEVVVEDDTIINPETPASPKDVEDTSEVPKYDNTNDDYQTASASSANVYHLTIGTVLSIVTFTRIIL